MPLYVWSGRDGAEGARLRKTVRPAHLENVQRLEREGRVRFAGPLLDASGTPRGSVIVFEAESLADAEAFANGDPYTTEGVFASVEVFESMQVAPSEGD